MTPSTALLLLCSLSVSHAFTAYDCSRPERVRSFSLLNSGSCGKGGIENRFIEKNWFSEIIQVKKERRVPVFKCLVIETRFASHCGMFSHSGVSVYSKWRQQLLVEPQQCREAHSKKSLIIEGKRFNVTVGGGPNYFHMFLAGFLDPKSLKCEGGNDGLVVQSQFEAYFSEEDGLLNEVTRIVNIPTNGPKDIISDVFDRSASDSEFGTFIWEVPNLSCPDSLVSLYHGPATVRTNDSSTVLGGFAIIRNQNKSQVAGLELEESIVICGAVGYRTHIKDIIFVSHQDKDMTLGKGKFESAPDSSDTKRLESSLSFITVQNIFATNEVIRQVKSEICINRKKLVDTWLSSIATGEHPYIVEQLFGRGHLGIRSGAAVYISRCSTVEVTVRNNNLKNCTAQIPVYYKNASVFVDPITMIIQDHATTQICNQIAPPMYKIAGQWFCGFPALQICPDPEEVPVQGVKVDELSFKALHFGESMYSNEQLADFAKLKESMHARHAYIAEISHQAAEGQAEGGEWGMSLGSHAVSHLLDTMGEHFIPYYRFVGRPALTIVMMMFIVGIIKLCLSFFVRAYYIAKEKGCGLWLIAGLWSTLFYLVMTPPRAANSVIEAAVTEAIGSAPMPEKKSVESEQKGDHYLRERMYPDVTNDAGSNCKCLCKQ